MSSKGSKKRHWNEAYRNKDTEQLGWYEEKPLPSLELVERCGLAKDARILNVGAGASTLIDELLERGYENLIATDISEMGLQTLKDRLGREKSKRVEWIVDDLAEPRRLDKVDPVDLWHDRAVLHFLVEEEDQMTYFDLLRGLVRPGGYVIIAAFNLEGASMCSGLSVKNYNAEMLADQLGPEFEMLEAFDYLYVQPSGGKRPYVYGLFKRKEK